MVSPETVGGPKDKLILVVGSTGDLGGLIARRLLSKGERVRVLVRSQSSFQHLTEAGAQAVFGDLKDRSSLDPACKGVDVLITTATSAKRGGADTVDAVDLKGNRNLIDAAKFAGVKQFIFVSANIAFPDSPIPLMAAKAATEGYLRGSGIPYSIVAPDAFMQVWIAMVVGLPAVAGKPVMFVGGGNRRHSFISDADVANFIAASIENEKALCKKVVIGGPEALSFMDAVRVFERALNRKIAVQSVAAGQPIPGFPEAMTQIIGGFDMYDSVVDMNETSKTFGVRLTSLEDFAKGFVASVLSH